MSLKKIYVGEDQPALIKIISTVLKKKENYESAFFSDGLDLYRKVQEDPPHLMVLDIIMPSMTGLAICRLLKFHDHYKNIPVIIMSSITDSDIRERAKKAGADVFLPKPFKIKELLDEIDRLAGNF